MNRSILILILLVVLAAGVAAQGRTATDFGTLASFGPTAVSNSVPPNTRIEGKPIQVPSQAGGAQAVSMAVASGATLHVSEMAVVQNPNPNWSAAAGTTTRKGGKLGDTHAVVTTLPVKSGTKGRVRVQWMRHGVTPTGASLVAVVNVNGKDAVAFSEKHPSAMKAVNVTAGPNGVTLLIKTSGQAAVKGQGLAVYHASLTATFEPVLGPSNCQVTPFGKPCGLALSGQASVVPGPRQPMHVLDVTLAGLRPGALGFLLIGHARKSPIQLPAGGCGLWVDPVHMVPLGPGQSMLRFPFPPSKGFTISFQAGMIEIGTQGVKISTSNGLTLKCP